MYPCAVRGLHGVALAAMVMGTTVGAVSAQRGVTPVPAPMPAVLRDYRPVTAERLKNPEDENWLMIRRTYDGWGGDSRGMQATLNNLFPGEYPEMPEGGAIWVFAVD
jgi:hypothetical protein